jgi:uncharacterized membrane protein
MEGQPVSWLVDRLAKKHGLSGRAAPQGRCERAILHKRSTVWQKLAKCYPPQLELISLFLLVLTFYLALSDYSALPDTIPTHFDAGGKPDAWGGKSAVLVWPAVSAFIFLLITSIGIWFAIAKDPRRLMNLPRRWKAALTVEQTEELRVFMNRCLFLLKLVIQGLAAYGIYIIIEIAQGNASGLGTPWFLFAIAVLTLAGLMLWKSFRLYRTARRALIGSQ